MHNAQDGSSSITSGLGLFGFYKSTVWERQRHNWSLDEAANLQLVEIQRLHLQQNVTE